MRKIMFTLVILVLSLAFTEQAVADGEIFEEDAMYISGVYPIGSLYQLHKYYGGNLNTFSPFCPSNLVFDSRGNLFAANSYMIYKIFPNGAITEILPSDLQSGHNITNMAVDNNDNLYFSRTYDKGCEIVKLTRSGAIVTTY